MCHKSHGLKFSSRSVRVLRVVVRRTPLGRAVLLLLHTRDSIVDDVLQMV
jgi:hypothetical protein